MGAGGLDMKIISIIESGFNKEIPYVYAWNSYGEAKILFPNGARYKYETHITDLGRYKQLYRHKPGTFANFIMKHATSKVRIDEV